MVKIIILRTNGTLKTKKINDKRDSFNFEHGEYFIFKKHILNKKTLFGYIPYLLYIEGFSEPISILNIIKKQIKVKNKEGEIVIKEDETILIDAFAIHNMADRKVLSVLTKTTFSSADLLILFLIFITLIASIAGAV